MFDCKERCNWEEDGSLEVIFECGVIISYECWAYNENCINCIYDNVGKELPLTVPYYLFVFTKHQYKESGAWAGEEEYKNAGLICSWFCYKDEDYLAQKNQKYSDSDYNSSFRVISFLEWLSLSV